MTDNDVQRMRKGLLPGLLLFGCSFIYGFTGSTSCTELEKIARRTMCMASNTDTLGQHSR